MNTTRRFIALAASVWLTALLGPAAAQPAATFPSRTVTIVLPTPAGGPSDSAARLPRPTRDTPPIRRATRPDSARS